MKNRDQIIVQTGIIGILANVALAATKVVIGLFTNSIAIILDGANNLSDALSSVITIVGTKLSNKPADKKHPMGYGRIEYLTTLLIAGFVLFAGFTSLLESIKKIVHPEKTSYSLLSILLLLVAIGVKVALGRYTKSKGEEVQSDALIASGLDAMSDAVLSATTVLGALLSIFTKFSIESYLAFIISGFIVKSGIEILVDVLNQLLGSRADASLTKEIKRDIANMDNVLGAFDLYLDSYGPKRMAGSVHIEIPDTMTATEIDTLSRSITAMIFEKYNIVLTCGIYAIPTQDTQIATMYHNVKDLVQAYPGVLQMHGFHVDMKTQDVYFDIVRDFSITDPTTWLVDIVQDLKNTYPTYTFHITMDIDYND